MGDAPSTCNNRYDGTITSLVVTYSGGKLDAIANPNGTFNLYGNATYSVAFTIHTQNQNSNGNTLAGTTWYDQNLYGFYGGVCHPSRSGTSIGPNQDVSISMDGITHPCCGGYMTYQINFGTFPSLQHPVTFNVKWEPPPSSTSSTATSSTTAATSATSSAASSSSSSPTVPSNGGNASQGPSGTSPGGGSLPLGLGIALLVTVGIVAMIWLRRL